MLTIEGIDCPKGYRVVGYRPLNKGDLVLISNGTVDRALNETIRSSIILEKVEPELRWQAVFKSTKTNHPREVIGVHLVATIAEKQSMKHDIVAWIEHTFVDGELVSSKVERV